MSLGRLVTWAAGLFLALPLAAQAQGPNLTAYAEGVRLDLETLRFLPSARDDGPMVGDAFKLPGLVKLRAVRDEVVAFQVLVTEAPGSHALSVDPLESKTSTIGPRVSLYVAHGIRIAEPTTSEYVYSLGAGLYPGPLEPTGAVVVPKTGAALIWVDAYVPLGTEPGVYNTLLHVGQSSLPFQIEVLPLDLPHADVARLGTVNFGSLLEREQEQPGLQLRWMQMAHAHGISVEMMLAVPKVATDGTIDWRGWGDRIGHYIDGTAFSAQRGYVGPRAGRPATRWILPLTDWWPNKASKDRLPSKPERWSQALHDWEAFAQAEGWFDVPEATTWVLFVNSLDEPHDPETIHSLVAYGPLVEAAKLQDRSRVLFRVDGNWGQKIEGYDDDRQEKELGAVIDLWNVHSAPYTFPWSRLKRLRDEEGDRVMAYFSNSSGEPSLPPTVIDTSVIGMRAWGWMVVRYGLEGLLNWEIDYWAPECPGNPRCSPGGTMNLEANLIFRAESYGGATGQPWASIRLKGLRRGAQDAALWSMLNAKDPELARRIVEQIVPRALGDDVPETGVGAWSLDPRTYRRARNAILDRLIDESSPVHLDGIRRDALPLWMWDFTRGALVIATILGLAALLFFVLVVKKKKA